MEQVRLIGLTAALSFLIWIVADYSLSDTATLQLALEPFPASSETRVYVRDDSQRICEAVVTGKRALISTLQSQQKPLPVRVPVAIRTPGDHDLDIKEALMSAKGELGDIIVQDVDPPELPIRVDHDKVVTMPVFVRPGTLDYDGPIAVDPTEVEVTMSELDYAKLNPEDRRVVLDPDEYLRTAPRGEFQSRPVPLRSVVGGYSVQLNPDFVTVKFKLSEQLQEMTISAVPIKIEASLDIFNRYRVEVREPGTILTQPLTVKARSEVLERIRSDAVRIYGVISVTAADKAELDQYRYQKPQFNLPDGVELASDPEPIEFRLVPLSKETVAP
ncbi:MAG TPA: hypothetical protein P5572_18035 [Phycisphaerae bacterium]|nr:hypothetical protein [Phycisphaerales bacterium]HRX86927.1 hypothetical protein [Phycisphaerae bacterium]